MSFLTIGGQPYLILSASGAQEQAREYGGALRRAYDGSLRNATRYRKRAWQFTVAPMLQASFDALDAATSLRQIVGCNGDALGGAVNCAVILQGAPYMPAFEGVNSPPLFYSLTVGDGTWTGIGHSARTAANFACSDGIMLDLISDLDAVNFRFDNKSPIAIGNGDPKIIRYRIARNGGARCAVSLYDITANIHRAAVLVDFTAVTPVFSLLSATTGQVLPSGQFLSGIARGDGSYEVTMRSLPLVMGNAHQISFYPAVVLPTDQGSANVGHISIYDDAALTAGFRRTANILLMEA